MHHISTPWTVPGEERLRGDTAAAYAVTARVPPTEVAHYRFARSTAG
ncbi:hypothetical protein [Krasilnikovia sp. MM14-A1259]